jgi:hypothetical protein
MRMWSWRGSQRLIHLEWHRLESGLTPKIGPLALVQIRAGRHAKRSFAYREAV